MSPLEARRSLPSGFIQEHLTNIQHRIVQAAEKSGRSERSVCLVAVTKRVEPHLIGEILGLGVKNLGESRVQEAFEKRELLRGKEGLNLHLIGHLQTNKAKKAVGFFDLIQSVDSPKLAVFLDRAAAEVSKKQRCLVEVKVSEEENKT